MEMKNIAILGGSFNPMTISHVQMCEIVAKNPRFFDEVWVSPCYSNAYKNNLASPEDRWNMCNLATHGLRNVKVCDFEIKHKIKTGTYDFLKLISKEYNHKFYYIIGGDQAKNITSWINYEKLIKEYAFVVFNRIDSEDGMVSREEVFDKIKNVIFIDERIEPLSSTAFRESYKNKDFEKSKYFVDYRVFNYIEENGLYD